MSGVTVLGWALGLIVGLIATKAILDQLFRTGYSGPVLVPLSLRGLALYAAPALVLAFPIGYAVSMIGRALLLGGAKREEEKYNFPAVQTKTIEGWAIGEKPKGTRRSAPAHTKGESAPADVLHVDPSGTVYAHGTSGGVNDKVNWQGVWRAAIWALVISSCVPVAWLTWRPQYIADPTSWPSLLRWSSLTFVVVMLLGWIRVRSRDYKQPEMVRSGKVGK